MPRGSRPSIAALTRSGARNASEIDLNQLTLTRYLENRREWARKHEQKLELPDHYPVTEEANDNILRRFISRLKKIKQAPKDDFSDSTAQSHSADLRRFISQLEKIGRAPEHDFIVIDTPGGVQHLSLIAHGMADTLITPINDSFVDLDVLVAMGQSDLESLRRRHTPKRYAELLKHEEQLPVTPPTGSSFATDWNQPSQAISAVSVGCWT